MYFFDCAKAKKYRICLQIFRKVHILVSPKQSVILLLKCVFHVRMSVFVLVCVIPPTASLPNCNLTHRVASGKHTCVFKHTFAAMEASKQSGSDIADATCSASATI